MSKNDQKLETRKSLILEAAITCFIEKGIHQTGVRDIARQAGISLGNLYNHFSSKEDLIIEIAAIEGQGFGDFISLLQSDLPSRKILKQFIDTYLAYCCELENTILTVEIMAEGLRNKPIAMQFDKNRAKLVDALISLITRGINEQQINAEVNALESALLILDVIEGMSMRFGLTGDQPSKPARTSLQQMIEGSLYR